MTRLFLPLVCFCFVAFHCTAQPVLTKTVVRLDNKHVAIILDSVSAAQAIVQDVHNGFFDKVNVCEMSIQMKRTLNGETREQLLPYYMGFLQTDVRHFDQKENKFTAEVIQRAFKTCAEVNPDIFPDTLLLIKTAGKHYGDGVWYTRENCIIIPANELDSRKTNPFTTTMLHEIFHVYSRLNAAKQAQLYQLIGFNSIGYKNLLLPPSLAERVLHNPDGVDFAQKIDLKQADGNVISAVPIIVSNQASYQKGRDEFFGYLEFNIYEIRPDGAGKWAVVTAENGWSSTLNLDSQPDFFKQIKDNTGYIIHPDEVLADNFAFIMNAKKSPMLTAKFSPEGKQLLKDVEALLK